MEQGEAIATVVIATVVIAMDDNEMIPTDGGDIQISEQESVDKLTRNLVLGLVMLQEMTESPETCPGENDAPCCDLCACHIHSITGAMLEILMDGPQSGPAKQFLHDAFETYKGIPRSLH